MKFILSSLFFLLISANTSAFDLEKSASGLMGSKEGSSLAITSGSVDYAKGLLPALSSVTGANASQSEAGAGSIFGLAKENLSGTDFSALTGMIPGLNMQSLVAAAPAIVDSGSSLTSMLGSTGGSAAGVKKVYDQFNSLGLSPEQLTQYVDVIQGYVTSEGGQSALELLKKGIGSLAG